MTAADILALIAERQATAEHREAAYRRHAAAEAHPETRAQYDRSAALYGIAAATLADLAAAIRKGA